MADAAGRTYAALSVQSRILGLGSRHECCAAGVDRRPRRFRDHPSHCFPWLRDRGGWRRFADHLRAAGSGGNVSASRSRPADRGDPCQPIHRRL